MPNNSEFHSFYTSKRWRDFRKVIIAERKPICEMCGKVIINPAEIEVDHYPIELTVNNVQDASIALNPANVRITDHECHNKRHNRYGNAERAVYIVYGPPCSGTSTFFGLLTAIWFIINELLSILENAGRMGAPLPDFLKKVIAVLKTGVEKQGNAIIDKEDKLL